MGKDSVTNCALLYFIVEILFFLWFFGGVVWEPLRVRGRGINNRHFKSFNKMGVDKPCQHDRKNNRKLQSTTSQLVLYRFPSEGLEEEVPHIFYTKAKLNKWPAPYIRFETLATQLVKPLHAWISLHLSLPPPPNHCKQYLKHWRACHFEVISYFQPCPNPEIWLLSTCPSSHIQGLKVAIFKDLMEDLVVS